MTSIPNTKKKYRVRFKQSDLDETRAISAHYLRVSGEREREIIIIIIILLLLSGQSVMLIMDNEGNVGLYSIPELTLIHKENCVDASDAV